MDMEDSGEWDEVTEWRPNLLTRETMETSARGEDVHQAKDLDDLFEQLGI